MAFSRHLADSIRSFCIIQHTVANRLLSSFASKHSFFSVLNRKMSVKTRPIVYVTRRVPSRGLEMLRPVCDIRQWDSDLPIPREEILHNVPGIDALFCLLTDKIDKDVIQAAGSNLKVIGTMSVGYDHIDLNECKVRQIPVGYTPDVLTDATAELTVALLLATSRRITEGVAAVKSGEWSTWAPLWMCGQGLSGSTVGIVGLGRIGLATAKRLQPFGVDQILYSGHSRKDYAKEISAEFVPFEELLGQSDFVVATCPMTPETKGVFNKAAFERMKDTAVFVNTSRGPVVNQEDLYEALKNGNIRSAGLDVTVPEPLPTDSKLLTLPNCVILPHIGSATEEARQSMSELTARNILAALKGEPIPQKLEL